MILLDTSAWIHLFKHGGFKISHLERVATCAPIVQEVLQGIGDDLAFQRIRSGMTALPMLEPNLSTDLYIDAAKIYRQGRKQGHTIRSSIDCLIAAIGIKHDIAVVHLDRDFNKIAKYSSLKEIPLAKFI